MLVIHCNMGYSVHVMDIHAAKSKHTWTILYKKEKTSETLAFFLDVATTDLMR